MGLVSSCLPKHSEETYASSTTPALNPNHPDESTPENDPLYFPKARKIEKAFWDKVKPKSDRKTKVRFHATSTVEMRSLNAMDALDSDARRMLILRLQVAELRKR